MGTFKVPIEVGAPDGSRWERIEALADTGALFTAIPRTLWDELGLETEFKDTFELADGRQVDLDVAPAAVRLDGLRRATYVIAPGDAVRTPLLGAYTLEAFGLAVDPRHKRLIQVPGPLL